MVRLDLEGAAEAILRSGGQELDSFPRLGALAKSLLGPNSVAYAAGLPGDGALVRVYDRWRMYIRPGLTREQRGFAVSHEIAEYWFRVVDRSHEDEHIEEAANYVAAALVCPRTVFRRVLHRHGPNFAELAKAFRTTESLVALREAELTRRPRALVTPHSVRVRGPLDWVWPDESTLRRWVFRQPRGIRKVRLTDDPRRHVLDADEDLFQSAAE